MIAKAKKAETHPAAPVMMAFLPSRRSPRLVLGMTEIGFDCKLFSIQPERVQNLSEKSIRHFSDIEVLNKQVVQCRYDGAQVLTGCTRVIQRLL